MRDYDKSKEFSYLKYWDVSNLYGWLMLQKLQVNNFEQIEESTQFNEDFIKNYNEQNNEGRFLEFDVQYRENYIIFTMIYSLYRKERKVKITKSFWLVLMIKLNIFYTYIKSRISFKKRSKSD